MHTGWTRHAGWRWGLATAGGWIAGLAGGFMALGRLAALAPDSWDSGPVNLAATLLQVLTGYGVLGSSIGTLILAALGGAGGLGVVTGLALATLLGVPALRPQPGA